MEAKTKKKKKKENEEIAILPLFTVPNLITFVSVLAFSKFSYDLLFLKTELTMEASLLNNTPVADKEVVFFNRVPKVGSQTIMSLLKHLQYRNNFTHYLDDEAIKQQSGERTFLNARQLKDYSEMFLRNFTPPSTYSKHIHYIDFQGVGEEYYRPIYLNFVREPIQRIISWYYYVRAPWYLFTYNKNATAYTNFKPGFSKPRGFKVSYEDCVLKGDHECRYPQGHNHMHTWEGGAHVSQMSFFCGHDEPCTVINGEELFRRAKENVEKYYAVVGILEEMEKSLTVMEHYIPRFFKGALEVYNKRNDKNKHVNKNIFRPPVENSIKNLVKKNLTKEVEFYEFCKQRLHKQYLALGL